MAIVQRFVAGMQHWLLGFIAIFAYQVANESSGSINAMKQRQYPNRIRLNSYDAQNFFEFAESEIREGYTENEMKSGMKLLDTEEILDGWEPQNRKSVALRLCLSIGWDDDHASDYFFVLIVTNDIAETLRLSRHKGLHGEKLITCHEFDWPKIRQSILNIIDRCERPTFEDSWAELRKRFDWEYEGEGRHMTGPDRAQLHTL